jgi:hypothetical protein
VAAAANAIVGLEDEWVEVLMPEQGWPRLCRGRCYLSNGGELKVYRRASHQ